MYKKLFLDIETIPADESKRDVLREIYDYKTTKNKNNRKVKEETFDEYLNKTNFDGSFGRIFCISIAINDDPAECIYGDEKEILEKFWNIAEDANTFIGHNVFDFDLRFIYQRSIILGVRPTLDLSFARYRNNPIYDTMYEWSKWNMQDKISLDKLAKALDIKSSKGKGIDGSKVYEYFKKGKHQEIYDYCNEDVEVTRAVYKRMVFDN